MSERRKKPTTPQVRVPQERLVAALRTRYRFLRSAAAEYDNGDFDQVLRMAIDLRSLLHFGSTQPLLHKLRVLKKIKFTDTTMVPPPPPAIVAAGGGLSLAQVQFGEDAGVRVIAPLGNLSPERIHPPKPFTRWWKDDGAIGGAGRKRSSRGFLVTSMANTEAAHVDDYLDGDYHALKLDRGGWGKFIVDGVEHDIKGDVATASMRQVTWEVLDTLERECGEWVGPGPPAPPTISPP